MRSEEWCQHDDGTDLYLRYRWHPLNLISLENIQYSAFFSPQTQQTQIVSSIHSRHATTTTNKWPRMAHCRHAKNRTRIFAVRHPHVLSVQISNAKTHWWHFTIWWAIWKLNRPKIIILVYQPESPVSFIYKQAHEMRNKQHNIWKLIHNLSGSAIFYANTAATKIE